MRLSFFLLGLFVAGQIFAQEPKIDDIDFDAYDPMSKKTISPEPEPFIEKKRVDVEAIRSQSTRIIEHPNAERGLIKIDKKRNYIYRVKESEKTHGSSIRLGLFEPTELRNPKYPNIDFTTVYTENRVPMVQYEMDKPLFRGAGILGYKVGFGFYYAGGTGRYEDPLVNPNEPPLESFSLFAFPISFGLNYSLQFWDTQLIVPYGGAGGDLFALMEYRDDKINNALGLSFGGAPAFHFNAGLKVRLGRGSSDFLDLDREYGINSMYAVAEYRRFIGLSSNLDFSADFVNAGIYVEY
jgi:hypothetical protein